MAKHINFLGYSTWIPSERDHEESMLVRWHNQFLYSPRVLAVYSFLVPSIGVILYGINLYRRDEQLKGKAFIIISCGFIFLSIFFSRYNARTILIVKTFSPLVALSLYQLEKSHFNTAMRNGSQKARWWPPLIGILLLIVVSWLFAILFPSK
jgi:hypothetical protein